MAFSFSSSDEECPDSPEIPFQDNRLMKSKPFYGKSVTPKSKTYGKRPCSTLNSASSTSPRENTPSRHNKKKKTSSSPQNDSCPKGHGSNSKAVLFEGEPKDKTKKQDVRDQDEVEDKEDLANEMPQWYDNFFSSQHQEDSSDFESIGGEETMSQKNIDEESLRPAKSSSKEFKKLQESLQSMKNVLEVLCEKVENNEKSLMKLQRSYRSSSSDSSSAEKKKRVIPLAVRQEVRKVYRALVDDTEDENFNGWFFGPGKSINSGENQLILKKIVKEVKGLNPSYDAADIREAAYRFYKSKSEEDALKRSGKAQAMKVSRRRHERITRKRKERETALLKNAKLTEDQRRKWLQVMTNEFMSSEESNGEDDTITVHPLPWRSTYVNQMFSRIDTFCNSKKSPQSRRQMKERKIGTGSNRPYPQDDIPEWAVQGQDVQ